MLCESESGYVWNFVIYTGQGTMFDNDYEDLPVSSKIVMTLMKPLLKKGYCLTMDDYYNSPQLADLLTENETDVYGTVRVSRKEMPSGLKQEKLQKGGMVAYKRRKVTAIKWKDKKDVVLLSTVHNTEMVETEKRGKLVKKPKLVMDYNNTMGGVDKVDQRLQDYPLTRKRRKRYYKKIFFHIVDFALWNSYLLYLKSGGEATALKYRLQVIDETIKKYHTPMMSSK
ncbi:piggyBac transposable element-derived protein 4-like [Macrobrachium rosenbergii]|uniref:piggyBac transposable element-derived protein 4-like n=1 Tax=Macrobrachium rosenbergii TaxID=79674 RepID=UPI0034D7477C